LPEWSNPYEKNKDLTITLDEKGKEHRSDKLPTTEEMMLVAEVFSKINASSSTRMASICRCKFDTGLSVYEFLMYALAKSKNGAKIGS
jgi:hypothetical protein